MTVALTTVDLVTIAAYFVAVLALGLWAGRRERDAADYFLAGRTLPWALIGLSLYASNMSGASFVGLVGAAYEHGMTVFNYEWTATIVLVFFAAFMLPVFLRARIFTVPEYLEWRFDRRCRWAYAAFTILAILFIDTAGALYAGGIVSATVVPALSLWQTCAALALVAGAYTLFGGLRAVVVTDALQAVLMIAGAAAMCAAGLEAVGGWDALFERLDPAMTRLIRPADDPFMPWPGILGVILLGFYYWSLNQYFVQRALAARSLEDGRKGALFGGLLKLPNLFLMIVPGMIAAALMPGLASPDMAFPALAFELLPVGLRGLVITALIAAIMSSLDSALNAAASMLTMDFVRPLRPQISGRALLAIGRGFTAILMVLAALYAPMIERFGSLFAYFQSTLAYLVPPIVAVYMLGLFRRRTTPRGAFAGIVAGVAIGFALFAVREIAGIREPLGMPDLHFTIMAIALFVLTLAIVVVADAAGHPLPAPAETVFRREDLRAPRGLARVRDYRGQAAALIAATCAMIVWLA